MYKKRCEEQPAAPKGQIINDHMTLSVAGRGISTWFLCPNDWPDAQIEMSDPGPFVFIVQEKNTTEE